MFFSSQWKWMRYRTEAEVCFHCPFHWQLLHMSEVSLRHLYTHRNTLHGAPRAHRSRTSAGLYQHLDVSKAEPVREKEAFIRHTKNTFIIFFLFRPFITIKYWNNLCGCFPFCYGYYSVRLTDLYLVVLLRYPGWNTLTVVAPVRATGTVSTTTLHQEAARPENGIRPFKLFTQGYGEVTWSTAVQSNLFPQQIEISSAFKAQKKWSASFSLVNMSQLRKK